MTLPSVPDAQAGKAVPGEIIFLFIGGAHQVYHLAPAAAALSQLRPDLSIACLSADPASTAALRAVRAATGAGAMGIEEVAVPFWGRMLAAVRGRHSSVKRPLLLSLRQRLGLAVAIVTPERTSAVLRRFGLQKAMMIHFRHGAGDRAPASERRLAAFDLVVVAGEKDLRRALDKGYLPAGRLRSCGYVKLDYFCNRLERCEAPPDSGLFDNGRPTVLYNPHFDPKISSWSVAGPVIERFRAQDRYNLIFAPHIRAAEDMSRRERQRWNSLAEPGRIIVDLASPALLDMTYIQASDIYLGDISSQLYEFLIRPRPVAFLNTHKAAWRSDPRFAGWMLGEVAETVGDVPGAIDRAVAGHAAVAARQEAAVLDAFGDFRGAAARAAGFIAEATPAAPD